MSGMAAKAAVQPGRADRALTVVGIGELKVTGDANALLVTYALGSCLCVIVHDPVAKVGGLLHAMLPRREGDAGTAPDRPGLYVDSGIPALFRSCYELGARKDRLRVCLAGAASVHGGGAGEADDHFQVGRRNLLTARQLFWKNNVMIHGQDVGGSGWRTVQLDVGGGNVVVRSANADVQL
ncbi:MAG TPA: chemotaxis protein CheD [Longimicrobiales bacterium]|nr:chemotaxis protein CheD [Longimicrobiales bacterium]